jgi:hypothetical protein
MIRVLISIAPRSYRESLALVLQRSRPDSDVRIVSSDRLEAEAQSFEPHMVVCNDEPYPELADIIHSRVEILFIDDLHANISVDGQSETIRDVSVEDVLKVLDRTRVSISDAEVQALGG